MVKPYLRRHLACQLVSLIQTPRPYSPRLHQGLSQITSVYWQLVCWNPLQMDCPCYLRVKGSRKGTNGYPPCWQHADASYLVAPCYEEQRARKNETGRERTWSSWYSWAHFAWERCSMNEKPWWKVYRLWLRDLASPSSMVTEQRCLGMDPSLGESSAFCLG